MHGGCACFIGSVVQYPFLVGLNATAAAIALALWNGGGTYRGHGAELYWWCF